MGKWGGWANTEIGELRKSGYGKLGSLGKREFGELLGGSKLVWGGELGDVIVQKGYEKRSCRVRYGGALCNRGFLRNRARDGSGFYNRQD